MKSIIATTESVVGGIMTIFSVLMALDFIPTSATVTEGRQGLTELISSLSSPIGRVDFKNIVGVVTVTNSQFQIVTSAFW